MVATIRVPLPEGWRNGPAPNPERRTSAPDRYHVMQWVIGDAYWDVLAWRHDGLEQQAQEAERICLERAERLRRSFDPNPKLGPAAADAAIAWAVRRAELQFSRDLANEQRVPWRQQRGKERAYF